MKVHKITLSIINFDEVSETEIKSIIENTKYPNWCISPKIIDFETKEIEWEDSHPLNKSETFISYFRNLFDKKKE